MHFRHALMFLLLEKREDWIYSCARAAAGQPGGRAPLLEGRGMEAKVRTEKASRHHLALCGHARLSPEGSTGPARGRSPMPTLGSVVIRVGFAVAAVCPAVPGFQQRGGL